MSFVALGGDGSTRPTFFELVAAERLMPSLKAATVYSLSVCCTTFGHSTNAVSRQLGRGKVECCEGVCPTEAFLSPTSGSRG